MWHCFALSPIEVPAAQTAKSLNAALMAIRTHVQDTQNCHTEALGQGSGKPSDLTAAQSTLSPLAAPSAPR